MRNHDVHWTFGILYTLHYLIDFAALSLQSDW